MRIPGFVIPATVGRVVSRLPQLPPTLLLVGALNLALGRILPRERLQPLIGKRLLIAVTDAGLNLRFSMTRSGFVPSRERCAPDLTISAATRDYLALVLREEDPDTLFFSRRLLMEGDTDLGLLVKNTLDAVELPDLAALSPAHVLNRLLHATPR